MSTIKTTERLLKRATLVNLTLENGSIAITPLLSGAHGLGKSAICRQVAKDLGGLALVVEGGSLKEGEITGLPFARDVDGHKEVSFVPYFQTARIQALERLVYEKAKTTGLLNGTVKLNDDGSTSYKDATGEHVIPAKTQYEDILAGSDNSYKFGESLPAEIKLKLLKSKDVMPVILFIDEMNRTDSQTMKELMNIVLTRNVNGYQFPWWVFMVSAINPSGPDSIYSTNELDAAQLDRFLKIKVDADLDEWVDYALDKGINDDYIIALSTSSEIFSKEGKGYSDSNDDMDPTPRSHELCAAIYSSAEIINESGFFTVDEMKHTEEDIRALINGKIGMKAGRTMMSAIKNRENFIDPADLITGKTKTISDKYAMKISGMKTVARRVLIKNVIRHLSKNSVKAYYDMADKKDADKAKASKETWTNVLSQVKNLLSLLDDATQLLFAQTVFQTNVAIEDSKYSKYSKESMFKSLVSTFSSEILQQVTMTSNLTKSGDIDKK